MTCRAEPLPADAVPERLRESLHSRRTNTASSTNGTTGAIVKRVDPIGGPTNCSPASSHLAEPSGEALVVHAGQRRHRGDRSDVEDRGRDPDDRGHNEEQRQTGITQNATSNTNVAIASAWAVSMACISRRLEYRSASAPATSDASRHATGAGRRNRRDREGPRGPGDREHGQRPEPHAVAHTRDTHRELQPPSRTSEHRRPHKASRVGRAADPDSAHRIQWSRQRLLLE